MAEPPAPKCQRDTHNPNETPRFLHFIGGMGWLCSNCLRALAKADEMMMKEDKEQNERP